MGRPASAAVSVAALSFDSRAKSPADRPRRASCSRSRPGWTHDAHVLVPARLRPPRALWRSRPSVASDGGRRWGSAKGAVDNDFVESALEKRELLVIEPGNEQLRDPAGMDGRRLTETGHARRCECDHDTAGVATRSVPAD